MQSVGNNFWGDVVLNSFNKAYRDGDNIYLQINICKYARISVIMIYPILWVPWTYVRYFIKYAFTSIILKMEEIHSKDPKIFFSLYVWS